MRRWCVAYMNWDDIKIGMEVIAANGVSGKITDKEIVEYSRDYTDRIITATWDNGNVSRTLHRHFDLVTPKEES